MFSYEEITRPKTKSSFTFCPCLPPSGPHLSCHWNEASSKQLTNYWQSALQTAKKENTDRIPFTLTFHPHNHAVKSIILKNFKLLQNDSETGTIFSQPPLISFKRDKNIGNFLVRSSFQTNDQSGTFKCTRSRCKTCPFTHNLEKISGPKRIHWDHWSLYVYLGQCHLLHNLHSLQ